MHLIDVTNNYSNLVHSQLNTTDANYVKVYSLGNTSVIYTESKNAIGIALENHDRRVREDEIEFVIKRLIKDYDSSYTLTVDKSRFRWISLIRQPDFVDEAVFAWAREELGRKRPEADLSRAYLWRWEEGLCAQLLHRGPYDDEPESVVKLAAFVRDQGFREDFSPGRYHHEIYLGDPRRTAPDRLRTVIRHPVREACVSNA